MKIACVGAHDSRMDRGILAEALELLRIPLTDELSLDMIDLRNGRDFLKESLSYDVVTLNYIFVLSPTEFRMLPKQAHTKVWWTLPIRSRPEYKTSELHTSENWRRRLILTGAKEILIFGFSINGEVTGDYIGELQDYNLRHVQTPRGSIWRYSKR